MPPYRNHPLRQTLRKFGKEKEEIKHHVALGVFQHLRKNAETSKKLRSPILLEKTPGDLPFVVFSSK
jgi:hypothetical protein